jgi:hypothetical protein
VRLYNLHVYRCTVCSRVEFYDVEKTLKNLPKEKKVNENQKGVLEILNGKKKE